MSRRYCSEWKRFQTADRIPQMTNALFADGTLSYFATLGDNWYDPKGDISQTLYARYSKQVLQAVNVVVPGYDAANSHNLSHRPTVVRPVSEPLGSALS